MDQIDNIFSESIMSKRSSVLFKQQQMSPYEKCFQYQSYKIMNRAIEFLNRLDFHKVLTPSRTKFQKLDSIIQRTRGDLKFFHLDVRHNQVYYEILQKEERIVFKRSLNHSKTLHEWRFPANPLSTFILYEDPKNLAEVLGKVKFLEMKKRNLKYKTTLHIITLKALGNAYTNFEEFELDLEQCINLRLFDVYEGRALDDMHFYQKSDGLHKKVWEFIAIEITRVWHFFKAYVNSENIKEKHTRSLYDDFTRLFKTELDNKINSNETVGSLSKKFLQCQKSFGKKPNHICPNLLEESHLKAEITLQAIEQNQIPNDVSSMKNFSFYRQSLPENYPLAKSYFWDSSLQQTAKEYYRTSLKRPANTCHQNCECIQENGRVCENMERKTECETHECSNSQIRLKRDIFCWYLDDGKNMGEGFEDQLRTEFELKEFHAFGLDFYTVRILYYLLPFYKMEVEESKFVDEENADNEDIKQQIISTFIPYQLSKTGNLISAIMSLGSDREYRKFHYECKILQKKLRFIKKMELINLKDAKLRQDFTYPKVADLKWFYKGLGVINVGSEIPKGKFVGKFIGEILPLWRQEDIQECLFRQYHDKANQIKFYCITAHSHLDQKQSPRVFSVDPQKKGNFCRSLNHSCNPNCKVQVMVSEGKYVLGVYAQRNIREYQELTFDYMSVTDNYEEYVKSVCLCSSLHCRGKYLRYQEEIQSGLDFEFMEKRYGLSRRIKELIKCCSEPEMKVGKFEAILHRNFEGKALCLGLIKNCSQSWFFRWVQKTLNMIQEEIKYVMKKQNKGDPKNETVVRFSECGKTFESQNNFLQKERLEMLNGKIEKLEHLFSKINDASPPFRFETKEKLIVYLSSFLRGSKRKEFDIKGNKEMSVNQYKEKVEKLRWELFREGIKELKDGRNSKKAHEFFQAAFTFILIKLHKYPDYRSSQVQIRRENQENLSFTIQCQGDNYYILQSLVVWSGEFKRFKQFDVQEQNESISDTGPNSAFNAVTADFKRSKLIREAKLAMCEFQEERFGLKKPAEIKHLQLFLSAVSIQKLEESLKLWISKEAELIARIQQMSSMGTKNLRNASISIKNASCSLKNLRNSSVSLKNQNRKELSIRLKNEKHSIPKNEIEDPISLKQRKELKHESSSESIQQQKKNLKAKKDNQIAKTERIKNCEQTKAQSVKKKEEKVGPKETLSIRSKV